jgi:hypothetical protein
MRAQHDQHIDFFYPQVTTALQFRVESGTGQTNTQSPFMFRWMSSQFQNLQRVGYGPSSLNRLLLLRDADRQALASCGCLSMLWT